MRKFQADAAPRQARFVLYLAVLPAYRSATFHLLKEAFGDSLAIYVSPSHLDPTVKTGIDSTLYTPITMKRLSGRAYLQTGSWLPAVAARTTVVDLNPRSATAWILLLARRLLGKRTLTWGHVSPQAGAEARTAAIRRVMRRLSSGTITYTYSDQEKARRELPGKPTWVAPNAIYRQDEIHPAESAAARSTFLYVGRFEPAKKVDLLIRGFALAAPLHNSTRLVLIGAGSALETLKALARQLGVESRVDFPGWVSDSHDLEKYYSAAICSVSPGFAGLGLTQSLGFGVPSVVADDEPHSPEIELASTGAVKWFVSNKPADLARALVEASATTELLPLANVSRHVFKTYSAEAMAVGLENALRNHLPKEPNE